MNKRDLSAYMSKIGTLGGKKSRRSLTSEQAKNMQQLSLKAKKLKSLGKQRAVIRARNQCIPA